MYPFCPLRCAYDRLDVPNYVALGVAFVLFEAVGIVMAANAVMKTRTSQGAIAWAIGLITFPYAAVPLYLIFGRHKFEGYIKARKFKINDLNPVVQKLVALTPDFRADLGSNNQRYVALEHLADHALYPFQRHTPPD